MIPRRILLAAGLAQPFAALPFAATSQEIRLPGRPRLVVVSTDPLRTEAPLAALSSPYTATELHFVHYEAGGPPSSLDTGWTLGIGGDATPPASWTLAELRALPQVEIAAVCRCPGGAEGAMGCALWRGPRLADILARSPVSPAAVEAVFTGQGAATYQSRLPIARAVHPDTIVAIDMHGAALPPWNGAPARLVVPGHAGTAWVKHLVRIELNTRLTSQAAFPARLATDSVLTSQARGERVRGTGLTLQGQTWDDGTGIARVEVSITAGTVWGTAMLGFDRDPYGFRSWSLQTASSPGPFRPMFRAVSRSGFIQPARTIDLEAF